MRDDTKDVVLKKTHKIKKNQCALDTEFARYISSKLNRKCKYSYENCGSIINQKGIEEVDS